MGKLLVVGMALVRPLLGNRLVGKESQLDGQVAVGRTLEVCERLLQTGEMSGVEPNSHSPYLIVEFGYKRIA